MKIHFFRMETPAGSSALWTDAHKTFELTSRTRPNSLGYQFFHSLTLDGFWPAVTRNNINVSCCPIYTSTSKVTIRDQQLEAQQIGSGKVKCINQPAPWMTFMKQSCRSEGTITTWAGIVDTANFIDILILKRRVVEDLALVSLFETYCPRLNANQCWGYWFCCWDIRRLVTICWQA